MEELGNVIVNHRHQGITDCRTIKKDEGNLRFYELSENIEKAIKSDCLLEWIFCDVSFLCFILISLEIN